MRTWQDNDPKARVMERKRAAIVEAALQAFLGEGYAGSSVNRIAAQADVSIKTLYRHFDDKGDLFVAAIQKACAPPAVEDTPAWFSAPPAEGLVVCGREHLAHILSPEQLALYRVVARESPAFPELGRRYQQDVVGSRIETFTGYLAVWPEPWRSRVADPTRAAHRYATLLSGELFEAVLLGGHTPTPDDLERQARDAASDFLLLVEAGRL
ncbi:TetR/AcrR family transcriptional regulator [Streptomyces sp. NPDC088387]|uniref:TetR/AcrR family transcriptional regulator n=1 Tax=Streptomyces sp. NPDC088387 TaxID=3365859 RepID=UPI0038189877